MSTRNTIQAKHRPARTLAKDVIDQVDSDNDVILVLGEHEVSPERIVKIMSATIGDLEVELEVRHAELKDYFLNMRKGAAIGASASLGCCAFEAFMSGNPVGLGALVAAAGMGALVGALVGAGATPISYIAVYKHAGETRMRFEA